MLSKFFLKAVVGEPVGFMAAALLVILGVACGFLIAVELPSIHSFRDIAWPSVLGLVFAALGAGVGVRTLHLLQDQNDVDSTFTA